MRIRRVSFVGVQTDRFDAMAAFVGWLFFRAPDGFVDVLQQDHAPPMDRGPA